MFPDINTQDWSAVQREAEGIFRQLFADADFGPIHQTFADIEQLFLGRFPGYQSCDMCYHDSEHTLEATVAMARLLDGMDKAPDGMALTPHGFTLGMHAVLMHDAGYLKLRGDTEGTGAKYTLTHVNRSAEFANRYLRSRGYPARDRAAVGHMIQCTGFFVDSTKIPFQSEMEQMLAFGLGTADLLGQMAAPNYLNELDKLFEEFQECVQRQGPAAEALAVYRSAEDMRVRTPQFFRGHVMRMLTVQWGGVYRFLDRPLGSGKNPYLDAVARNIRKVDPSFKL
ncbi:MAG: hypothetical protein HZC54_06620 [Verrucomicrobia bacterium]|nr:hypothetical protein [Verrucomicrobiota bacterium]